MCRIVREDVSVYKLYNLCHRVVFFENGQFYHDEKKSPRQRKEMLLPFDRFRCLRCCVVMAELPSSAESCIEPVWIATQTHLTQAGDFSSWVLGVFFLFLRLMTLPPLYSGVMCNADSGARRARPVKSSIFPSLAPSPNTSTCEERRTYQHFCRLRANSVRTGGICERGLCWPPARF